MSKINWKYEIGQVIKDEKRDMIIIDREMRNRIQYYKYHCNKCGHEDWIRVYSLNGGSGCNDCMNWKYEIGDVIKDEKRDMIIIDREIKVRKSFNSKSNKYYDRKDKWYKYKCSVCGYEGEIVESSLYQGRGCLSCNGTDAIVGRNSIWETDRWLVTECGLNEEFAKTHKANSNLKAEFTCKKCGNIKTAYVNDVKRTKSIGCSCGDNFSYPEKFIYSILKQLNIDFKLQLNTVDFKWINTYKYDFYIPSLDLIIETHGEQHGRFITKGELTLVKKGNGFKMSKRNDIKNDADKCWLAYDNGVDKYIQLDCYYSNIDYIKNSILNSKLTNILDLSNIDWNKCEEFALSNLVKEVCDYWNEHREINGEDITTSDLVKIFNISKSTIKNYLKKGTNLEWCSYNPKKELKRSIDNNAKKNEKIIYCIELNKKFKSIKEASKELNLDSSGITKACKGKNKTCGGYHWEYVEELEEN